MYNLLICSITSVKQTKRKTLIMQPQEQYAILWEICKSFSKHIFNSSGNLPHCGRSPRCSDVEIIALSLFQEVCSIDSERRFFNALQSMLPDLYFRVGSRRNYNARKRRLACYIEQLRVCCRPYLGHKANSAKLVQKPG